MENERTNKTNDFWTKLCLAILGVLLPSVIAFGSYILLAVHSIHIDVARINASRFTAQDANRLVGIVAKNTEAIAAFPTEIPPPWFREEVRGIDTELKELRKEFRNSECANK